MTKAFLSSPRTHFEERNIRESAEFNRELVENHQSHATPTLVIGGRVINGFEPGEYDSALRRT